MGREGNSSTEMASTLRLELAVSRPAFEALIGAGEPAREQIERGFQGAISLYLNDKASGRVAWPYPSFLRGSETAGEVPLEIEIDADLADAFAAEASEQSVSLSQLAEHAASTSPPSSTPGGRPSASSTTLTTTRRPLTGVPG
jgi:hypothetical protein